MDHLLSTAGLVLSGGVGLLTIGVAIYALKQYTVAAYQWVLLLLIINLAMFTTSHWLMLIWPTHPILLDLLEPLAYTGLLVMVYQFASIHPQISHSIRRNL